MRRTIPILLTLVILNTFLPGQALRRVRDLTIPRGKQVEENILSWKGRVEIQGTLAQSLFMLGGRVDISGTVEGDVITFSSRVNLEEGAHIKGELLMIGGRLDRVEGVRIEGGHLHFHYDLKRLRSTLYPVFSETGSLGFFRAAKIIIWFVIALLTFMLFPARVAAAEGMLAARGWRIGITGLITLIVFAASTVFCLLLSFVIIGIPLLFLLILAWFAVLVFGRTVLYYFVGLRIVRATGRPGASAALVILAGALTFGLLKFIPLIGGVVLLLFNLVEVGVGAAFLLSRIQHRSLPA